MKQLNVNFKKVAAHTGVKGNETADLLVKEGLLKNPIKLKRGKRKTIKRVYQYKGQDVNISLREFGKTI